MAILNGTNNDDELVGSINNDIIRGRNGIDFILADAGNDIVFAGNDDDLVFGDAGNDILFGDNGNDTVDGGAGNDQVFGGRGNDNLTGDIGNDILSGNENDDFIDGGDGTDVLFGGTGSDSLNGGLGNDTLWGGDGDDFLLDVSGNNTLLGGNGADVFIDVGNSTGRNTLFGGAGSDLFVIGAESLSSTGIDVVRDFRAGAGGDVIDVTSVLNSVDFALGAGNGASVSATNSTGALGGFALDPTGAQIQDVVRTVDADGVETLTRQVDASGNPVFTTFSTAGFLTGPLFQLTDTSLDLPTFFVRTFADEVVPFAYQPVVGDDNVGFGLTADMFDVGVLGLRQAGSRVFLQFDVDGTAGAAARVDVLELQASGGLHANQLTAANFTSSLAVGLDPFA